MQVLVLLVSFFACTVGAICGIGGGIIIKPVLDATGVADVATINFLSGCTVLSMTLYSVLKAKLFMGLMVLIILINAYNIYKFALA